MNESLLTLLLIAMLFGTEAKKMIVETGEGSISEDVIRDPDGKTLLVMVGDVSMTEHFVSTVNLHDISTGWVALKNVDVETCLLKPISKRRLLGMQKPFDRFGIKGKIRPVTLYWRAEPDALSYEEVEDLAGAKLAEFCEDYKTYVITPKTVPAAAKKIKKYGVDQGNRRYKRKWCFLCWNCCNVVGTLDVDEVDEIDTGSLKV